MKIKHHLPGAIARGKQIKIMKKAILPLSLLVPSAGFAQTYSIDWYKVAGGGGTSAGTNGGSVYSLSGTIGQPDAGGAMTGGNYSLTGGFWSIISIVQTANAPALAITRSDGSVVVSWPSSAAGFTLQQNTNLAATNNWMASGYSITTANGTNSITITPPAGNLFFRLANP
jgi:hypothetical protein